MLIYFNKLQKSEEIANGETPLEILVSPTNVLDCYVKHSHSDYFVRIGLLKHN